MQIKNDIAKYIKALLYEYSSIIIPDLGTFNTHYTAAQLDKDRQVITPPAKVLVFNDRIKVNDGLLAGHISRLEQLPIDTVEQEIEWYVRGINQQLRAGETAVIEGIGKLHREGDFTRFEPIENANFAVETFGLTPVALPDAESGTVPTINDLAKTGAGAAFINQMQDQQQHEASTADANHAIPLNEKRTISSVIAANNAQSSVVVSDDDAAQNKKSRWWLWLLPLLLLFAFLFTLSQMGGETDKSWYYRKPFSWVFGDGTTAVALAVDTTTIADESPENDAASIESYVNEDSINQALAAARLAAQEDSVRKAAATASERNINKAATAGDGDGGGVEEIEGLRVVKSKSNEYVKKGDPKGYYIITGAFKEKSRAEKVASVLRKEQSNVHILQTKSGFYRTGIYSKSSKIADVKTLFNTAQSKYNPDSWVLKYN